MSNGDCFVAKNAPRNDRVLVYTPTWVRADGSDAIEPLCSESIQAQTFEGEWVIGRHNPYPVPSHRNVLEQYQNARAMLLADGFDALVTVEHDIVLPAGAIEKLIETPGDVVYGVYVLRHFNKVLNTWKYWSQRKGATDSLSYFQMELRQAMEAGEAGCGWRVWGAGFGCTLIRRHVMERFEFHRGAAEHQWCPDFPLAEDCWRAGLVSLARFDVACGHVEAGQVLYPFHSVGTVTAKYVVELWNGFVQYRCPICQWDTMNGEQEILAHWDMRHK